LLLKTEQQNQRCYSFEELPLSACFRRQQVSLILALAELERRMSKKWRLLFWWYGAGAFLTVVALVYNAYGSGGFQRNHTSLELLFLGVLYLATSVFWPAIVVLVILRYFGVLPQSLTF
jgi:hypothetical protein